MKENRSEWDQVESKLLKYVAGTILLGFVVTTAGYLAQPFWNDLNTRGTEHSYTFVSSQKDQITKGCEDYRRLEARQAESAGNEELVSALEGQKSATVDRINSLSASIPHREVPQCALPFLR